MKIKQIEYMNQISYFSKFIPVFKTEKSKILHKDKIIKVSKISGTVAGALPSSKELPQFTGVPVENLIGKQNKCSTEPQHTGRLDSVYPTFQNYHFSVIVQLPFFDRKIYNPPAKL